MKKSIMQRWVKALRSGKYRQTKGRLADDGAFCCLGVLCEISRMPYSTMNGTLPSNIIEWAGMKSAEGKMPNRQSLVGLNDEHGFSFKKIANIIERGYKTF